MTFIRPVMSYTKGIVGGRDSQTAKSAPEKEIIASTTETIYTKNVNADDVFNFMNASYAQVKPTTSSVNANVSFDCKKRIKESVNQFETMFNATLEIIKGEFGDILSDDAMNTLTLQLLT